MRGWTSGLATSPTPDARCSPLAGIRALLLNAANVAQSGSKKRKSVDEGGDGDESPIKRRTSKLQSDGAAAEDDDEADGSSGFGVHEVKARRDEALMEDDERDEDDDDDEDVAAGLSDVDSPRTSCKPCPLVESISKKPLRVL